jgi:hypothetical protein
MKMVGHQRPSVTDGPGFFDDGPKSANEVIPIDIAAENLPPLDSSADDVVQRARCVYAGFSRHGQLFNT